LKVRGAELKKLRPIPWFIPSELGGLGLPCAEESQVLYDSRRTRSFSESTFIPMDGISGLSNEWTASDFDRLRANYLLRHGIRPVRYTADSDWLMRSFADDILQRFVELRSSRLLSIEYTVLNRARFNFPVVSVSTERFLHQTRAEDTIREEKVLDVDIAISALRLRVDATDDLLKRERGKGLRRRADREEELQLRLEKQSSALVGLERRRFELQEAALSRTVRSSDRESYRSDLAWWLLISAALQRATTLLPESSHEFVMNRSELAKKVRNLGPDRLNRQRRFWASWTKTDPTAVSRIYMRHREEEEWLSCPIPAAVLWTQPPYE
jgi:hypothetical protein